MITAQTLEMLGRLKNGIFDPNDAAMLEQTSASQLVAEMKSGFPVVFQERHLRDKWEISLARSLRTELAVRSIPDSLFVSFLLVPVYVNCVMLSIEDDSVTGISRLGRLSARAVSKPAPGLAVTTGTGFKLDKLPDGWEIKRMRRRTVKLTEPFLRSRGWKFDHLTRLSPAP